MSTVSKISNADLEHILAKTRDAAAGAFGALSLGEALAAALVLNRPDWLAARNYTIAEALERVGPEWVRLIPAAAKQFDRERDEAAYESAAISRQAQLAEFSAQQRASAEIDCSAKLITSGSAPGYRDVHLTFDLKPIGGGRTMRTKLRVSPEDGEALVHEVRDIHKFAWRKGAPIDAKPNELRPAWIDGR